MMGVREVFTRASRVYRERWRLALAIILLSGAAFLAAFLAALAASLGSVFFAPRLSGAIVITAMTAACVFSAAAAVWSQAALILAAALPGPAPGLAACLESSWRRLPGFFLVCCLYAAACVGGTVLLVVPGLAASLRLVFAPMIYMTEEVGVLEALLKSDHYMKGRSWPAAGRLCLVGAAGTLPGLIPAAGAVLQALAWPGVLMSLAAMLEDLRRARGGEPFLPSRRDKVRLSIVIGGCLPLLLSLPWVLPWLSRCLASHSAELFQRFVLNR